MTRDLPGMPRGRLRSHAEDEPIPERVYAVLHGFDTRIGGLEEDSQQNKRDNAAIRSDNAAILTVVRNLEATDRHATSKMIAALVVTVITTLAGVIGTIAATRPSAAPPAPARSALDVRLDTCRPMPSGPSREDCFARVTAETEH